MNDMQRLEELRHEIVQQRQKLQALQAAANVIGEVHRCYCCKRKELFRPGQWPAGWSSRCETEWDSVVTWHYCPEDGKERDRDDADHWDEDAGTDRSDAGSGQY